jgi:uncharacterized protein
MPSPRTTLRRLPTRGSHDRRDLDAILDEGLVCHVGFVDGGLPVVVPTGFARDGDRLLLHGSRASRMMQALAGGADLCVTVTLLDGLVLARSAFHHSMNYRSAVLFGRARAIADSEAKWEALRRYVERLVPGRWDSLRAMNATEMAATAVVEFPIGEFSVKSRSGPPKDDAEDADFPVWAGVVPLRLEAAPPLQDPAQKAMPIPHHVSAWSPART